MISIVRLGLCVLLMMLQLASPLIHAHKNDSNVGTSIHLPEFEQISQSFDTSSMLFIPPAQNDQVVTISAGMKNNKRRVLLDNSFKIFVILSFFTISILHTVNNRFSIKTEPINSLYFFNLTAPRAPPFSLCC